MIFTPIDCKTVGECSGHIRPRQSGANKSWCSLRKRLFCCSFVLPHGKNKNENFFPVLFTMVCEWPVKWAIHSWRLCHPLTTQQSEISKFLDFSFKKWGYTVITDKLRSIHAICYNYSTLVNFAVVSLRRYWWVPDIHRLKHTITVFYKFKF